MRDLEPQSVEILDGVLYASRMNIALWLGGMQRRWPNGHIHVFMFCMIGVLILLAYAVLAFLIWPVVRFILAQVFINVRQNNCCQSYHRILDTSETAKGWPTPRPKHTNYRPGLGL